MHEQKKPTIILGAGPAGLACAYQLSKNKQPLILVEKDHQVGGLAKTLNFTEKDLIFKTDIGPHRFFSKNQKLYDLLAKLLGSDWQLVNRQTRQYIRGKFYSYPINAWQAFKNIGLGQSLLMLGSYLRGIWRYKIQLKPIKNFEDYIVANFGYRIGSLNMLNYTAKIWGIPCDEIHPDWASQRIKGLNFISAVKNALFKKSESGPKTLVDNFYYPRQGSGQIYENMASEIRRADNQILLQTMPTAILHHDNRLTKISLANTRGNSELAIENLISSIPIDDLIKLLQPQAPQAVLETLAKLRWRDQIYLFITLDQPQVTNDNWIYFPDQTIPFARISEMKNFSLAMAPANKTSLFVEFFCNHDEELWQKSDQEIFTLALEHLEKIRLLSRNKIRNFYVFKKLKAYPIYDLNYLANLKIIKNYLNQFSNLIYIGRPGRFHYTNQDHSLEMGLLAAQSIIDGNKYDLDSIGSENRYYEEGNIENKSKSNDA